MYKYMQIMDYIKSKYINQDNMKHPVKLPSIRDIVLTQKCSKNSVIKAYEELEKQHLIYVIPQSGYYVVENTKKEEVCNDTIDLITANPDKRVLPYREFVHCMNRTVEEFDERLFEYPRPQGMFELRKELVNLFAGRQVYCKQQDIYITNGIEQAISLLFMIELPCREKGQQIKNTILFENPTYPLANKLAKRFGWKIETVNRNESGIDIQTLEQKFAQGNIQYFYTMPRFQNPLGTCLPEQQKEKIAQLAEQYHVYIIEDDYLAELETKRTRAPIHFYDISKKVVYLAGFSKSFIPGIRIGAACVPEALQEMFLTNKHMVDLGTSTLEQGALTLFIKNGIYNKHQKRLIRIYTEKMKLVKNYFENNTDISCVHIPESGYYCWLPLEDKLNKTEVNEVVNALKNQNILVKSGTAFWGEGECRPGIRICIANCEKERLMKAIQCINTEITKRVSKKR